MDDTSAVMRQLARAVDAVRAIDAELPIQTLAMLIAVALEEGKTVHELGEKTGLAQSSASRNVAHLSDFSSFKDPKTGKHRPGLKLVEYRQDTSNFSRKNVHLQHKGRKLIEHLVFILTGGKL